MSLKRIAGLLALGVAAMLMISTPALAKSKKSKKPKTESYASYAVPFSCGPNPDGFGGVVPATYETAVTVTNLNVEEARLRARYQLTDPRSPLSDFIQP